MTTNDDLDPRIVALLRDVPLSSSNVRDAHITQALAELHGSSRRSVPTWLSVAAASLALVAGGALVGRITANDAASPSLAAPVSTLVTQIPVKSGLPTACKPAAQKFTVVGRTEVRNQTRIIFSTANGIEVFVESSCELVAVYPHPPSP